MKKKRIVVSFSSTAGIQWPNKILIEGSSAVGPTSAGCILGGDEIHLGHGNYNHVGPHDRVLQQMNQAWGLDAWSSQITNFIRFHCKIGHLCMSDNRSSQIVTTTWSMYIGCTYLFPNEVGSIIYSWVRSTTTFFHTGSNGISVGFGWLDDSSWPALWHPSIYVHICGVVFFSNVGLFFFFFLPLINKEVTKDLIEDWTSFQLAVTMVGYVASEESKL